MRQVHEVESTDIRPAAVTGRAPCRHPNHSGKNKLSAVTNAMIFETTFIASGTGDDG
jgi:hypothetical protein